MEKRERERERESFFESYVCNLNKAIEKEKLKKQRVISEEALMYE